MSAIIVIAARCGCGGAHDAEIVLDEVERDPREAMTQLGLAI